MLLTGVDVGVVLEVVVRGPLGSENEFAAVVLERPVGTVTPLGRENEFGGLPITIDKP